MSSGDCDRYQTLSVDLRNQFFHILGRSRRGTKFFLDQFENKVTKTYILKKIAQVVTISIFSMTTKYEKIIFLVTPAS